MITMMIEATDKNIKVVNKYNNVTIDNYFGGYLTIKGDVKSIKRIARKVKALI